MLNYKSIRFLRTTALLLFIVPLVGLIGSLLAHNYLVSFKYSYDDLVPYKNIKPGSTFELICTKENNWCEISKKISKLDQCNKLVSRDNYFASDKTTAVNDDLQTLKRAAILNENSL